MTQNRQTSSSLATPGLDGKPVLPCRSITTRRRALLNSSCAVSALLVMPAALSVGVMLAGPARAQTYLGSSIETVPLANFENGNPFFVRSGTTINTDQTAVYGNSSNVWTLSNAGTIESGTESAIDFANGGTVTNTGVIAGADNGQGDYGILISGNTASIDNSGIITANVGVLTVGPGVVTNTLSGDITGFQYGVALMSNAGTVENSGTIRQSSALGDASAVLLEGGTLVNIGDIAAGNDGVADLGSGGQVVNSANITAINIGVYLSNGGTITNGEDDTSSDIIGNNFGIVIKGDAAATVQNGEEGLVQGKEVGIAGGSADTDIVNDGIIVTTGANNSEAVSLANGGTVSNDGQITGDFGIFSQAGNATVTNAGTILGNEGSGIILHVGNGSTGQVTNQVGGFIKGTADGVYLQLGNGFVYNYGQIIGGTAQSSDAGVYLSSNLGTVTNHGGIAGNTGVRLSDGGSVLNDQGGMISGTGNAVSISGSAAYVFNAAGADRSAGLISGAVNGVLISSYDGTVVNGGTIIADNENGTTASGIYLTNGGTVTNDAPGSIMAYSFGVQIRGAAGTVDNSGIIDAFGNGSSGIGIFLASGGYVSAASGGTIFGGSIGVDLSDGGSIANAGSIAGGTYGVYVLSSAGSLGNTGTITGNQTGVVIKRNGSVTNSGLIEGVNEGLYMYGQNYVNITNQAGGTITGARGLETHYSATLDNAGLIAGTAGLGMYLAGGGMLTNESTGTITGTYAAIRANFSPQTIQNAGLISSANADGIDLEVGGTITNALSGTIQGGQDGIYDRDGPALINNTGTISGACENGNENCGGIVLQSGGTVTNAASGVITGPYRGVLGYAGEYVSNSGTITATGTSGPSIGVLLSDGGSVMNNAGGTIAGAIGITNYGGTLNITNNGLVTAGLFGVFDGYGTLLNTGTILSDGKGAALYGSSTSIQNDGTILGGDGGDGVVLANGAVLQNNVSIAGGNAGVYIENGGVATNAPSAVIYGATGIIAIGNGSLASTIVNTGLVTGTSAGIGLFDGGTIVNGNAGDATGIISSADYGIFLGTAAGTVLNTGTIIGQTDAGIALSAGGYVHNMATGGVIGTIAGGNIGIGGDTAAVTLVNDGLVTGGNFGVSLGSGGTIVNSAAGTISSADAGIYGQNTTIQNAGLVSGTYGAGIVLEGGALTNLAGATINGGEIGLVLADGASASNAGLISDSGLPSHDGAVIQTGAALTNLAGGTITGGNGVVINGDDGTLFNAGTIIGTDGTAIAVGQNIDPAQITLTTGSTEIGTIDGGGTDGQIFLTGNNTLTNTIANFGAGSALDIVAGADWNAIGNWTVATVTNNGIFQPGILGTPLRLTGNFVQTSGATLQVVVTPTVSSQFIITGNAKLAGKLAYAFAPGTYAPHIYSFLTATGGVTGAFTGVSYNGSVPPVLTHVTQGVATATNLVLAQTTPKPPPTPTPPTPKPPPPEIVAPLDGSIFSDAAQAAATLAQAANGALLDHVSDAAMDAALPTTAAGFADETASPFGNGYENGLIGPNTNGAAGTGGQAGQAAPGGFAWLTGQSGQTGSNTSANPACAAASGATPDTTTSRAGRMTNAIAAAFCGAGGWIEAAGATLDVNGNADAATYHVDDGGFLAGMDRQVDPAGTRLGLAVGYDEAWLHDDASGKATIDTTRVGLYGAQPLGRFTLAGDVLAGFATTTTTRETGVGAAGASHDGVDYSGALQIATQLGYHGFILRPAAGIRFTSVTGAGFAESGGGYVPAFAVHGEAGAYDSVQPFVKAGVTRTFFTPSFVAITPSVSLGYDYEAADRGRAVTVIAPDGTHFRSGFTNLAPGSAELSAGVSAGKGNWALFAHYTAYLAGNWTAQSGEAGLQVKF